MRRALRTGLGGVLALWLVTGAPAGAHPHIWIEYTVGVHFGAAGPETVEFAWTFDEFTSSMLLQSFDADRNGVFSPAEVRSLEERHFAETRTAQYFVMMRVNDVPVPVDTVRDFTVRVAAGRVTYVFRVPVKGPPTGDGRLEVLADDPSVYAAFDLTTREPVPLRAPKGIAAACQVIRDPKGAALDFVRCTYKRGGR